MSQHVQLVQHLIISNQIHLMYVSLVLKDISHLLVLYHASSAYLGPSIISQCKLRARYVPKAVTVQIFPVFNQFLVMLEQQQLDWALLMRLIVFRVNLVHIVSLVGQIANCAVWDHSTTTVVPHHVIPVHKDITATALEVLHLLPVLLGLYQMQQVQAIIQLVCRVV